MICAPELAPRAAGDGLPDELARLGVPLADLTADSRMVKRGSVFVAYPGTLQDGRRYIADAIARGAAAVLWEREGFTWDERWTVPNVGIAQLRQRISDIAGHVYGDPSHALWMAGVTGTNGKTSVSQWIAAAADGLGCRSAVIGTLGNGLVGERSEGKNTTPDPIVLQRLLADYLKRGARCVAMEVSSHGLDQGRAAGIEFDVGVFTNLTRDHLDYHRTMEAYAEAKFRLFSARGLDHAVVNVDDDFGRRFAERLRSGPLDLITYGLEARHFPRLAGSGVRFTDAGVEFDVASEWGRARVTAGVLGTFNVSNLLAVLGALIAQGTPFEAAVRALSALEPVTGRLERVALPGAPLVVVDYAHTPDALEKALAALRPGVAPDGRLICVFGCGGDRDPGKRPLMGELAARLADHVIVTSDNPRSEPPAAIIRQVLAGVVEGDVEAIEDRQVAIFTAVHQAGPRDVILVAGKGHESYQEIAGVRHPFSDRDVTRAALTQWRAPA
ncbi:MAG TPA: UDP-N-acetylmuramoyl-L-alanyl-D-glutamate--2,6-diaminopimelate ligase [Usitatibacter sp.]|jgi:UDP-N-acetylmuramoyl-L-alanyl-D-glutamate--2,6-diaminopimelate ligase|nr:UDP-N-acetylmuramoyl-L-alanyl-D-glutamate--2,6-diaminopimelate ligase [Usitatibacter sp.]